ncbi:autotransporter outer membrane beta-barrel domain-containing protein [Phascolarctobacterium succinatutens]|uniref:autotransporter outer membrane beta-barrel domain-containing protein n=1 Tax=Phascolarctobacterium succinatutens TaxID=626940 RepID=UPI0026F2E395|nr:autotransporter outer membrane beta-barrel domain-containing protein [Phascolarctobacterium succinatutens]
MVVKVNHNNKYLAKKVLLSVVAAGVMTGFVMNAEAAEGKFLGNQAFNETNVNYEKVNASGEANVTLTDGVVTGLKESRFDPDDPEDAGRTHADVATEIRDSGTRVEANNIAFTGEVSAVEGSTVIINGGSVTAGNAYYDAAHGNKVEKLATEIGAHDGSTIELNNVKINSNLGAFDGGVVTVKGSDVNAAFAIYAEGKGTINLISTDGKATYTVGEDGVEAADGGVININGGTLHTTNISVEGNGSKFVTDGSVEAKKIEAISNASVILNGGGKITGYKYDDGNTLAASVTGNSTLTATNVDFTGDFKAKEGSKIILKGGSVTASDYYENGKKDGYTEFGAIGENSIIEAEGVDIKSATLATDGANVTIKNSNINTVEGIWAARKGTINLDGKATYTASGEGVEAVDGGVININGGGTLHTSNISVEGNGSKFITDGSVEAQKIVAGSNASVILNGGGKITGYKYDDGNTLAVSVTGNSTLTATNVDFTGDFKAEEGSTIILKGGSVTASDYYENGKKDGYTEFGAIGENSSVEADSVDIKSATLAFDGANVTIKNSDINTVEGIWAARKGTINLISTDGNATYTASGEGVEAVDGGVININGGGTLHTSNISVEGNGSKFITDGSVEAQKIVAGSNASVILNGGGKITGYKYDDGNTLAVSVTGNSTLTATNVDFTGDFKAEEGSTIILKGGSVTASDYYENGKKDGYTEFGAIGENSSVEADGVDIKSATLAKDGATVTIKNSSINTVEGIWAWNKEKVGKGSVIVLDGTAANVYTVGESIVAYNGSKIYINGGTLKENELRRKMFGIETEDGTINTDAKGIVLDKNGVISTMSDQIYANAASENQKESGAITNEGIDFKGGSLILNDAKYTQSYTDSAQAELKKQGATKLTMSGELVKEETGEVKTEISVDEAADKFGSDTELDKVTAKAENNLLVGSKDSSLAGKDIAGVNVKDQVENGFAVGKLDLGAGSNGVVITNDKEVTLGGSQGGSVITVDGADANVKVVVGTDEAGTAKTAGKLNIGNALATENTNYKLNGEVVINKDSHLNISGQAEITDSVSLNDANINVNKGALKTADLNVAGNNQLFGAVNADKLNAVAGTSLAIGNNNGAGKLTVETAALNGSMIFLDPAWNISTGIEGASGLAVKDVTGGLNGAYVAGQNSKLSFGADLAAADAAFARSGETWSNSGVTAGAYVDSTVDVTSGSITVDGSLTKAPTTVPANGSVKFADNSMLMVNASKISDTQAAITGVATADISANSKLYIDNAEKDKTYKIIDGTVANWNVDNILSNNKLLKFTVDAANNTVTTTSQSVKAAYGDAVIAGDVYDAAVLAGGVAADFVAKAADEHVNADTTTQVSAFNSAAALSELAGVEHGTYAASNLFTDAISEHMSLANEKEHDSDIWAKYIHSKENVDGLAVAGADSKYDVTYNGIVVGADLYKNGKATVGAALSYVDGSVKGNTLAARTENDATYYGASIYGGIQNEDSAVIGDISYLHGKNDITQRNSGTTLTADAKSDAFSIGVRAEKSLKAGVGKFVPYAGIRYMHLGTGNYNNSIGMSYDGDDMNLWLLPVGVQYSADVKSGDWTIRPIAEVGYVWNMGDRDATQTVSLNGTSNGFGYDVADNGSYIGRFVVEAEKANVTYGLGYEYQKGDSVKANKWMANVNWSF